MNKKKISPFGKSLVRHIWYDIESRKVVDGNIYLKYLHNSESFQLAE